MTSQTTQSSPSDERSTTFQPVEGGNEVHSGTTLMVEAYAAIWMVVMFWLILLWRKQATLNGRIDELGKAIDRAAAKQVPTAAKAPKPSAASDVN
jgi:hypothetical protein